MTDYVVDLQKLGQNFGVLANTTSERDYVALPNSRLSNHLTNQLSKVHKYLFGTDLPVGEIIDKETGEPVAEGDTEEYSFLLRYKNGIFDRVYYPSVVRGEKGNELAPDENELYIRWGANTYLLPHKENKRRAGADIKLFTHSGEELIYQVESYPYNGEKYANPSLMITFIDDENEDDTYSINFPFKLNPDLFKPDPDNDNKIPDGLTLLRSAFQRGIQKVRDLLVDPKEYKGYAQTFNVSDLEKNRVYSIVGFNVTYSRQGKELTKLFFPDGNELWCPYSMLAYIKEGEPNISEENPMALALVGIETQFNEKANKEFNAYNVAISFPDSAFSLEKHPEGTVLSSTEAEVFFQATVDNIYTQYKRRTIINVRELKDDVEYRLINYEFLSSMSPKLTLVDPETDAVILAWCPYYIIPTLKRSPEINAHNPAIMKVISRYDRNGETYARVKLDLPNNSLGDSIDLNFVNT